jgi:hypothetical protein
VGEEVERLEDHADVRPQPGEVLALLGQGLAVDADGPGVDGLQPVDCPAEGRLARPGRPDDDDNLAAGDGQVDVAEYVQSAEVFVDLQHLHQRRSLIDHGTNLANRTPGRSPRTLDPP